MSNSFYCNLKYQEYKDSKKNKIDRKPSAAQISNLEKEDIHFNKTDSHTNQKNSFRFFKILRKWMEKT